MASCCEVSEPYVLDGFLSEDPPPKTLAELYEELGGLIFHHCRKHFQHYGGDLEEYCSFANELFMRVVRSHDESRGPLAKRISFLLPRELLRAFGRARHRFGFSWDFDYDIGSVADHRVEPDLLSPDAQTVQQLAAVLHEQNEWKSWRVAGAAIRVQLVGQLRQQGWGPTRIQRAFCEIQELFSEN